MPNPIPDLKCTALLSPESRDRAEQEAAKLFAQMAANPLAIAEYGTTAFDAANKLKMQLRGNGELLQWNPPAGFKPQLEWMRKKRDACNEFLQASKDTEARMIYMIAVMELVRNLAVQELFASTPAEEMSDSEGSRRITKLDELITEYLSRLLIDVDSRSQVEVLLHHCEAMVESFESVLTQIDSRRDLRGPTS